MSETGDRPHWPDRLPGEHPWEFTVTPLVITTETISGPAPLGREDMRRHEKYESNPRRGGYVCRRCRCRALTAASAAVSSAPPGTTSRFVT